MNHKQQAHESHAMAPHSTSNGRMACSGWPAGELPGSCVVLTEQLGADGGLRADGAGGLVRLVVLQTEQCLRGVPTPRNVAVSNGPQNSGQLKDLDDVCIPWSRYTSRPPSGAVSAGRRIRETSSSPDTSICSVRNKREIQHINHGLIVDARTTTTMGSIRANQGDVRAAQLGRY